MRHVPFRDMSRLFPFVDFQGDMAIAADGTLSFCFQSELAIEEQYNEQDYINWVMLVSHALKELPCDTLLQQVDLYFPSEREEKEHRSLVHESYMVLCFPGIIKSYSPLTTFFSRKDTKSFGKNPFKGLKSRIVSARQVVQLFTESISPVLPLRSLSSSAYSQLVHRCLSLNFSDPQGKLDGGFWQDQEHIALAGQKAKVISLLESSSQPSYSLKNQMGYHGGVTCGLTDNLGRKLNFPHLNCRVIRMMDAELFLKDHFNQWAWSAATKVDERQFQKSESVNEEMLNLEQTLREREEPIVQLSFLVIPFGNVDLPTLHHQSTQVVASFSQLGMRGYIEDIDTANLFFTALPGNGNQMYRTIPIPLLTAVAHLNMTTPFQGHPDGTIGLKNRHQETIYFNPFNRQLDNQNAFIFGPSGSGKSFFNGKLIKDRFEAGHIVVVIDSGGTYRPLFSALEGKYIELTTDRPLGLNPFLFKPNAYGQYLPDQHKIIFLVQFMGKVWKGNFHKHPMSQEEQALLSQWILSYYNQLKKDEVPSLTGFFDYIQTLYAQKDPSLMEVEKAKLFSFSSFFVVLEPFAHGMYQDHFNATSQNYLLNHRLIGFELEAIKNNSRLYPLVVQILFNFAFEIVTHYPEKLKFIDIEEGWSTLDDASCEHIESFYRKGRKSNTSIRIITQDIEEIQSSKIASALKNNAASFVLLYNDKESSRTVISDFLGMNALDQEKYASLRRHHGQDGFREVFIKEMSTSNVWTFSPSLWEQAMLTSRPDERNHIARLIAYHGSAQEGMQAWITHTQQKYHG